MQLNLVGFSFLSAAKVFDNNEKFNALLLRFLFVNKTIFCFEKVVMKIFNYEKL